MDYTTLDNQTQIKILNDRLQRYEIEHFQTCNNIEIGIECGKQNDPDFLSMVSRRDEIEKAITFTKTKISEIESIQRGA